MLLTFFDTLFFKSLYLLKWCPIFDTFPLTQFSKFNSFLWVCLFLGKNLSDFVPPPFENPKTPIAIIGMQSELFQKSLSQVYIVEKSVYLQHWKNVNFTQALEKIIVLLYSNVGLIPFFVFWPKWPKNEKISCHFQAKCEFSIQKINKQDSWFFSFWSLWPKNKRRKMEWTGH